jgi:hypothetical protein
MRHRIALSLWLGGTAAGCVSPQTPLAKAQETTQEFNLDRRFGRADEAIEHVAPAAREEYQSCHRAWGNGIRIADVEMGGVRLKGDKDAEVTVRVAWYRPEQNDLRLTLLRQQWHEHDGWQLVSEQRLEGDLGLLGETIVVAAPDCADGAPGCARAPAEPARFPTIRLGNQD